jgi:hypothetical protein
MRNLEEGRLKGIIASLVFRRCLRLEDRIRLGEGFGCAKSDTGPVQLCLGHYASNEFRIPLLIVSICGFLQNFVWLVENGPNPPPFRAGLVLTLFVLQHCVKLWNCQLS